MSFIERDGVWIPRDAEAHVVKEGDASVTLDNRTDLPNVAILDYLEENTAAFGWSTSTQFNAYTGTGSMLARPKWRPPRNIIEEVKLARDLAERDDDVAPAMQSMISAAIADGYQNQHPDEQVQHTFDKMTEDIGLTRVLEEMYREWLISSQVTTATLFTRSTYDIRPEGVSRVLERSVAAPLIGVLPAEHIRIIGDDLFGQGVLAYLPEGELAEWLQRFFANGTSEATRAEMRRKNPVRAALFIREVQITDFPDPNDLLTTGMNLYILNPTMCQRTTMGKGAWSYPRPLLTRNFPLLEAKRLLNVMDFALLQGGTNYIVVAKKGSDQIPALPEEIANLREVVKRASQSGVLIGDHRVSLEVITPDLTELLNAERRHAVGRKLAMALMRVPEFGTDDKGQSVETFTELLSRVITSDRGAIRDHIHRHIWSATVKRNAATFGRVDRPTLWFPKLVLQGFQFFSDYLLKMYDRGDLPRKFMVEFGGYDYAAVTAQKEREVANGHDEIFQPPAVPFSSPQNSPQDNGGGRPRGSGPNNGAPGAKPSPSSNPTRPTRVIRKTPGETVRAFWSDEEKGTIRIGVLTERVIEEYKSAELGRLTPIEITACGAMEIRQDGPTIVVPVNLDVDLDDFRAVRLEDGLSIVVGKRVGDRALMARAFTFREPRFEKVAAEDTVLRWGFTLPDEDQSE